MVDVPDGVGVSSDVREGVGGGLADNDNVGDVLTLCVSLALAHDDKVVVGETDEVCVALGEREIDEVALLEADPVIDMVVVPVIVSLEEGVLSAVGDSVSVALLDIVTVDEGV